MDRLICPSCSREYQLPQRFVTREDDEEYMTLPRLLSCLHTVCQSCLETIRDKSKFGKIMCPICKRDETIKGVKYLPLDVAAMRGIIESSSSSMIATCARCIQEEPSVSWCLTCSVALCEFHHQDHEVSNETCRHEVYTFEDINNKGIHINPKLPPVHCPEEVNQYCTCYCLDCMHLISAQAMVSKHDGHNIKKCSDIWERTVNNVNDSINETLSHINLLDENIQSLRNSLSILDDNADMSLRYIESKFNQLREELSEREKSLKEQVISIAKSRRKVLIEKLNKLANSLDDCNHICNVSQGLLDNASDSIEGHDYLIAAMDSIDLRVDELGSEVRTVLEEKISFGTTEEINPDPRMQVNFCDGHVEAIQAMISSLGTVFEQALPTESLGSLTSMESEQSMSTAQSKDDLDSKPLAEKASGYPMESSEGKTRFYVTSSSFTDAVLQKPRPLVPGVIVRTPSTKHSIAIEVRREQLQNQAIAGNGHSSHDVNMDSQSKDSGGGLESKGEKGMIDEKPSNHRSLDVICNDILGKLFGKITIDFEMDKRLINHYEFRSHYETWSENGCPYIKISKALVPL